MPVTKSEMMFFAAGAASELRLVQTYRCSKRNLVLLLLPL